MKYPNENSLCIVKENKRLVIREGIDEFEPNTLHRVSFDKNRKGCLVFGCWFSIKDYEKYFIDYAILTKERLVRMGLMVNDKPISFKEFKERVYVVGRGYINLHLYKHPKDSMFSFYPWGTTNKVDGLQKAYEMFINICNGDMSDFDSKLLRWSNGGLPFKGYPTANEYEYIEENLKFKINLVVS
jgi:hypothetical protein